MIGTLHIIFATSSGHTEYVVDCLLRHLESASTGLTMTKQRAENAEPADFDRADLTILACGTWNTGGAEGQLPPHMYGFLLGKSKDVDLTGKKIALIALGDDRYKYTANALVHLTQFVETHGGSVFGEPLTIINEPYGQEKKVEAWGDQLSDLIQS